MADAELNAKSSPPPQFDARHDTDMKREGWHWIALSARTQEALRQRVCDLESWLDQQSEDEAADLARVACTLLLGRAHFSHRLALVVSSLPELRQAIRRYLAGEEVPDRHFYGIVSKGGRSQNGISAWTGALGQACTLARLYADGAATDWSALFPPPCPRKLRLPTYPFAQERHWMGGQDPGLTQNRPTIRANDPVATEQPHAAPVVACFAPKWVSEGSARPQMPGYEAALLFVDAPEMATSLKAGLERLAVLGQADGANVVSACPGAALVWRETDACHSLDPHDETHYEALLNALPPSRGGRRLLVLAWNLSAGGDQTGYASLNAIRALLAALSRQTTRAPIVLLQTWGAEGHSRGPLEQAQGALGRSLGLVLPRLQYVTVELALHPCLPGRIADALAREAMMQTVAHEPEVRLTEENRQVKRHVALARPATAAPRRRCGVWLVTGGNGGLGRLVTAHLVERDQARIALLSRGGPASVDAGWLAGLRAQGGEIEVFAADVAERAALEAALNAIRQRWGPLHGIVHAAGVASTGPFMQKNPADIEHVLRPKVAGTELLDELTRQDPLRFFVLFSSLAATLGDFGSGDYAVANRFLDDFAARREALRRCGRRCGITRSIEWPLWREGGMRMHAGDEAMYLASSGLSYLESRDGLAIFEEVLAGAEVQVVVGVGIPQTLESIFSDGSSGRKPGAAHRGQAVLPPPAGGANLGEAELCQRVLADLRVSVSRLLKLDVALIDPEENLGNLGFDSISIKTLLLELGDWLGRDIPPAALFGHSTLAALSRHLSEQYRDALMDAYADTGQRSARKPAEPMLSGIQTQAQERKGEQPENAVAIIGASGIFPGSPGLERFWSNLVQNVELTGEIPAARWDWRDYFGDPGQHPNKCLIRHGAFIDDPAQFDAAFFRISPHEAELMDPQQRLLLQTAWHAIEDAACKPSALSGQPVGVFVGVQFSDYQHLLARTGTLHPHMATGNANSIVANRISFNFNFTGPSESLDTACSSSLVAVHRAVRALRCGECNLAIAGGVNLVLSPQNLVTTALLGVLAKDGHCKTFDRSADGYVKGEGVAALVLKRLDHALQDGDPIRAVIRGSAVNHGGHASSLTAPNPIAQTAVIRQALTDAGVDAGSISYVEAHGTGTELGDPVEVEALKAAFAGATPSAGNDTGWCALGTVKTHIGHLEPAAGSGGLCAVMLSLEHRYLPGLQHFRELNPYIRLDGSPFRLVSEGQPWLAPIDANGHPLPRRAGVSSFGFGGCNAHVIVEEWVSPAHAPADDEPAPEIFPLSARGLPALRDYARSLDRVLAEPDMRLADLCHTFRSGREDLPTRAAIVCSSLEELRESLKALADGYPDARLVQGAIRIEANSDVSEQPPDQDGPLFEIARAWARGENTDWNSVHPRPKARRLGRLPLYPFAKTRFWVPQTAAPTPIAAGSDASVLMLAAPTWQRHDLPAFDASTCDGGLMLFFDAGDGTFWQPLFEETAKRWRGELQGSAVCITVAAAFAHLDNGHFQVRLGANDDLAAVADAVAGGTVGRVTLIYAGFPAAGGADAEEGKASASPRDRVWTLFALARLLESRCTQRLAILAVEADAGLPTPAFAGLSGLLRSWAHESRRLVGRLLSLDIQSVDRTPAILLAENQGATGDVQHVRYHEGGRQVERLARWTPPAADSATFATGGVFLVTGGAGGIGRRLCRRLAEHGARAVCVSGRSPSWPEATGLIEYRCLDIGDAVAVNEWVEAVRAQHGRIDGLFHLAGVLRDSLHTAKTEQDFDAVLRAKALGALHLDAATRNDRLRCFVIFSSLSGMLGNAGQTDYSYANCYADAVAEWREHHRNQGLRHGRSLSIAWPLWADGGMQVDASTRELLQQATGMIPLDSETGLALAMELAFADTGPHCVAVFHGDPLRGARLLGLPLDTAAVPGMAGQMPAMAPIMGAGASADAIAELLVDELTQITGLDREALELDTPVADYGLDSLLAVKLLRRIEVTTGLRLYPSELIEQSTLRKLAAYLAAELAAFNGAAAAETAAPAAAAAPVFLLSTPRAGSTLLRVMLMGNPRLYAPPELHLLSYPSMRVRRELMESSRQGFLGEGLSKTVASLLSCTPAQAQAQVRAWEEQDWPTKRVYDWLMQRVGIRRLVDKSPSYAADRAALERAEREFDQPYYIHLVRHPLAMAESFVRNRFSKMLGLNQDPWQVADGLWGHSTRTVTDFLKGIPQNRWLTIHYEDLVCAPETTLRQLCVRLGVDYHADMLQPYAGDRLTSGLHEESLTVGDPNFTSHSGIDDQLADAWQSRLKQLPRLSDDTRDLAATLGYEMGLGGDLPLTPAQEQFLRLRSDDPRWYIIVQTDFVSPRPLQRHDFDYALRQLVRCHAALRSTFSQEGGQWRQRCSNSFAFETDWIDADADAGSPPQDWARLIKARLLEREPALDQAPLLRCTVIADGTRYRVGLLIHHLIADGASVQMLLRHLQSLLAGQMPPPPSPANTFAAYVAWTRQIRDEKQALALRFWRRQLPATPLQLPLDFADGRNLAESERCCRRRIDTRAWHSALDGRESLFWFLNLSLISCIGEWAATAEPVIVHRLHRRRASPANRFESTLGWLAGDAPLRLLSHGGEQVATDIANCKNLWQKLPAGGTGYEVLALQGRLPPAHEVSPLRFNYQPLSELRTQHEHFDYELWEPPAQRRLWLLDWVVRDFGGHLELRLRYADDCFSGHSIEGLAERWEQCVSAFIQHWRKSTEHSA
jgi:acyl transferase domain-containing protein/acyl carrier protein